MELNKDCIFCKIIKDEIPNEKIYEDDFFKVVMDAFPASENHMLVIPKSHAQNLIELEDVYTDKIMTLAKNIVKDMSKEKGIKNFNILQNNGKLAGQTVFHYHLHIIPRYENDKITINWI